MMDKSIIYTQKKAAKKNRKKDSFYRTFLLIFFLFGNEYNPASELFAAGFMIVNTLLVSFFAILIAVPVSVFTAVFIAKVLPKKFSNFMFAIIAILAAIPSVVYGAFGAIIINDVITAIFNVQAGTMLAV